jgi:hypothetical protein
VLVGSGRLGEIFRDPQRFLDGVVSVLRHELPASDPHAEWA